jgi:hypothetical protein
MPETRSCWRCGEDVPALTEAELAVIQPLWKEAVREAGASSAFALADAMRTHPAFERVNAEHQRITGRVLGSRCLQVFHKVSDFGPACPCCGKPLRTAKAGQCFLCGWRQQADLGH